MKLAHAVLIFGVLFLATGAFAAPTEAEIESFISEIIKDARTNSERSELLMGAVSLAEGNPTLKIALLEKSVQYGIKGLRTPEDCRKFQVVLGNLLQADPTRKAHWLEQQASVFRRWGLLAKSLEDKKKLAQATVEALSTAASLSGAAGDWKKASTLFSEARMRALASRLPSSAILSGHVRTANFLSKTQSDIDADIATLKKEPDNFKVRSNLVKTLVTEMDAPSKAMAYLNDDVDQKYRMFVPMAAGEIDKLSSVSCKSLGDWYSKELSKSTLPVVKCRMLARARTYYKRVLELHEGSDVVTAALKLSVSRIESEQSKSGFVDPSLCMQCTGTGKMSCPGCLTDGKSTGLRRCIYCKGAGRRTCTTCSGIWRLKCPRCFGKGKVATGTRRSGGVIYKVYGRCSTCRGAGLVHRSKSKYSARPGACPTCSKARPEKLRGTSACTYCSGKGGTGTCYTCKGSKGVKCIYCLPGYTINPFRGAAARN
ncbi:MAG: hypothetical protein HN350_04925 [Phycisphaerales bacterium]|jgi:hypothetical protein|nr:hypothetical protein [Phycisphaerales bacterium]